MATSKKVSKKAASKKVALRTETIFVPWNKPLQENEMATSKKVGRKKVSKKASVKKTAAKAAGVKAIGRSGTKAERVRDLISAGLKSKKSEKEIIDIVVEKIKFPRSLATSYVKNNLPKVRTALKK